MCFVYFCKSVESISQTAEDNKLVFCIWMSHLFTYLQYNHRSLSVNGFHNSKFAHITILKYQEAMSVFNPDEHTQRHLVEAQNTISKLRIGHNSSFSWGFLFVVGSHVFFLFIYLFFFFTAGNLFPSHSCIGWPKSSPHRDLNPGPQIERWTTYQLNYPSPCVTCLLKYQQGFYC